MKDRLKQYGIRISELASYLNISRPSLYKYIDLFENDTIEGIPTELRQIFVFISDKENASKQDVIAYIINIMSKGKLTSKLDRARSELAEKIARIENEELIDVSEKMLFDDRYAALREAVLQYDRMLKPNQQTDPNIIKQNYYLFRGMTLGFGVPNLLKSNLETIEKAMDERRKKS